MLPELLESRRGEWALMHDGELVGCLGSEQAATNAGWARFRFDLGDWFSVEHVSEVRDYLVDGRIVPLDVFTDGHLAGSSGNVVD